MNVCYGYEKMSDKAKLKKLDELIKEFRDLEKDGLPSKVREELEQERAEVASRIGLDKNSKRGNIKP